MKLVFSCKCFVVWQLNDGSLNVTNTNPFTSPLNEADGRCVTVTFSMFSETFIFFSRSSIFRPFDSNSFNNSLISVFLCKLSPSNPPTPPSPSNHTALSCCTVARWRTLMNVSGPLHTRGYFHWALTSPDTLFTPPHPLRQPPPPPPHISLSVSCEPQPPRKSQTWCWWDSMKWMRSFYFSFHFFILEWGYKSE